MFGITLTASKAHLTSADRAEPWRAKSDKWSCVLTNAEGKTLSTQFYMGEGLGGRKPEMLEVLGSLVDDANGVVNAESFGEWMRDLGYEERDEAYKVYKLCASVNDRLEHFVTVEQREAILEAFLEM